MRRMLLQWHMANIEFANAAQLNTLSMKVRRITSHVSTVIKAFQQLCCRTQLLQQVWCCHS
jgi:hypothetical protein